MDKFKEAKRDETNVENKDWCKLADVCKFIYYNYTGILEELEEIKKILNLVEICGVAYMEKSMVAMHLNFDSKSKAMFNKLKLILEKLDRIRENSSLEFTQNIDFLNIYDALMDESTEENIVLLVWRAKKVLQYIMYQLERINCTLDDRKQVAILKGMIAYY